MSTYLKNFVRARCAYFFVVILLLPFARVFGQGTGGNPPPATGGNPPPATGGNPSQLVNPLRFNSITDFLKAVLEVLLVFAVPIIIFFIIYGGFKLVTAQGDQTKITDGKRAITAAIVGGVIVLGATIIMQVLQGTIDAFVR